MRAVLGNFARLKHPGRLAKWVAPFAVAAAAVGVDCLSRVSVLSPAGLVPQSSGLLTMLAAFYVGALGVFNAMQQARLDTPIPEYEEYDIEGKPVTIRRLLLAMFGYLALVALMLYASGLVASIVGPFVNSYWASGAPWLRRLFLLFYLGGLVHVLVVTATAVWLMSNLIPSMAAFGPGSSSGE